MCKVSRGVRHSCGYMGRWRSVEWRCMHCSHCVLRGKHLFSPLKPEEGITAEAFRLLYPQVIADIKVRGAIAFVCVHACVHVRACVCMCGVCVRVCVRVSQGEYTCIMHKQALCVCFVYISTCITCLFFCVCVCVCVRGLPPRAL